MMETALTKEASSAGEPVLSIRDLRMKYDDRYVLNGIDLEARPGQVIGYIGPNGAGKSTTIKIMLGLVQGYTGQIHLFGQDIAKAGPEYKRRIGYVPDLAERKASLLMKGFDLAHAIDSRIVSYSKGMRQKMLRRVSAYGFCWPQQSEPIYGAGKPLFLKKTKKTDSTMEKMEKLFQTLS